ncbi:serine protease [Aliidiomarina sedimenti]|uniref:Serine protease n=1 Tax=Aliidiomarina sedimenti TaxID=1933879 RepID=A0ABY0C174_9GAMM|nr:trypsin-like peptidase domain-containing protein [Aliidiomarina sedimenti]RUO31620.1 serine protease [Aliidiomarina sedimenti]
MTDFINPIDQLIHSTVRIICEDGQGKSSSGTGYIFLFCQKDDGMAFPCVVTNRHVVNLARRGLFHLTLKNKDGGPSLGDHEQVVLEDIQHFCIGHPDAAIDLVAIPIGAILNSAAKNGKDYYFVPLGKEAIATEEFLESLSPMEEIVMIGYPNGIWDEKHNLPVIRRGITATHSKLSLNGKPEFLIDAACFPGSSGSPVFLANLGSFLDSKGALCAGTRIALLGTLYAGPQHTTTGNIVVVEVPTDTKPVAVGQIPNNLGLVIQAAELAKLEEAVAQALEDKPVVARNAPCPCGSGNRYKRCCGLIT